MKFIYDFYHIKTSLIKVKVNARCLQLGGFRGFKWIKIIERIWILCWFLLSVLLKCLQNISKKNDCEIFSTFFSRHVRSLKCGFCTIFCFPPYIQKVKFYRWAFFCSGIFFIYINIYIATEVFKAENRRSCKNHISKIAHA